jgi:hypothetical protein
MSIYHGAYTQIFQSKGEWTRKTRAEKRGVVELDKKREYSIDDCLAVEDSGDLSNTCRFHRGVILALLDRGVCILSESSQGDTLHQVLFMHIIRAYQPMSFM